MKKILLLGGSQQQVIAVETAKKLGFYTVLCDYLADNPGQYYADKFYLVSTTDKEAVFEVAKNEKIDGVIAYASDPAAPTAAYVAEKLGLPGNPYSSVEILCNKDMFRDFLYTNDFCTPFSKSYDKPDDAVNDLENGVFKLPVIVKPVDSSGSKGVGKISDTYIDESRNYINTAFSYSRKHRIIIEEYVELYKYQVAGDGLSIDGKLVFRCFGNDHFDKKCVNPFVPVSATFPSVFSKEIQNKIHNEIQRLISLLDMKSTTYNFDIRVDKDENVYLMEIAPRSGGNYIPQLINYRTGLNLVEYAVRCAMGEKISDFEVNQSEKCYAYYALHSYSDGIFDKVEYAPSIKDNIIEEHMVSKCGDKISSFVGANTAVGIILLEFDDSDEMISKIENADSLIHVCLKNR